VYVCTCLAHWSQSTASPLLKKLILTQPVVTHSCPAPQIYLGHLKRPEAEAMVTHFFITHGTDSPSEQEALRRALVSGFDRVWVDGVLTPAELECMCLAHDTLDQLLASLEARLPPQA
jgi:hypothetical protein